jgi:hypothetical protein
MSGIKVSEVSVDVLSARFRRLYLLTLRAITGRGRGPAAPNLMAVNLNTARIKSPSSHLPPKSSPRYQDSRWAVVASSTATWSAHTILGPCAHEEQIVL